MIVNKVKYDANENMILENHYSPKSNDSPAKLLSKQI